MKPFKQATHRHTYARRKRLSIALAMLMALPTLAAPAAQAKTNHHYTSVIRSGTLSSAHGYPAPGAVRLELWFAALFGEWVAAGWATLGVRLLGDVRLERCYLGFKDSTNLNRGSRGSEGDGLTSG